MNHLGAKKSVKDDEKGWWTALISSDESAWQTWFEANRHDLAKGLFKDAQGATPLHWACLLKKVDITKHLLKAGANVWALDNDGNFPLKIAMAHGLSPDWDWRTWSYLYKEAFAWEGLLHPARASIGRHIFRAAQLEHWEDIETLMSLIPIKACPTLYWPAPENSGFSKMFESLGPMPWCHAAVFLQNEKFLHLMMRWGASLLDDWNGMSLEKISNFITEGAFNPILFKAIQQQCWPLWRTHTE